MPAASTSGRSAFSTLLEPLRDRNFSQLVRFLFLWSFASNLAIPFFAVYMLARLGLSLPAVIGLTMLSQLTSIMFVRAWGPLADRAGSKTVLSLSASLYLLVILGWIFTTLPEQYPLTLPLLVVLHIFAGIAMAGVTPTVETIALKLAPEGKATPFLGVAAIATGMGAGLGPMVGGLAADYFSFRSFAIKFSWMAPGEVFDFPALSLTDFDFLFVIAFLVGTLSLNLLVALREEGEVLRDVALAGLMTRAGPMARAVSSVPDLNAVSAFAYGYLRRVPGAEVAMGISAYQLASSTQAAVAAASGGRLLVGEVARRVGGALDAAIDEVGDVTGQGLELARHAIRGAVQVGGPSDPVGRVVRGAVLGTIRTLAGQQVPAQQSLRGAGYGAVQGAVESGGDPGATAAAAVGAARELASELGVTNAEAAAVMAAGALEAAAAAGEDALAAVRDALPDELTGAQAAQLER